MSKTVDFETLHFVAISLAVMCILLAGSLFLLVNYMYITYSSETMVL